MAHLVVMPKLGNTVESCLIVGWKAKEGDSVSPSTPLCEIETDKATMEVPAGVEGIILKLLKAEGDDVPVMEPIAVVGARGEVWDGTVMEKKGAAAGAATGAAAGAAPAAFAPPAAASVPSAQDGPAAAPRPSPEAGPAQGSAASPRAQGLAATSGLPIDSLGPGTGPGGRIVERDVVAALASRPGATIAARDLEALGKLWKSGKVAAGTGLGGRLRVADVLAAASAPESSPAPAGANPPAGPEIPGPHEDQPIRGIRKIIAERMLSSLRNSAQITLNSSAPAARLLAMRARFKATAPENGYSGITIGDLVAYAAVRVLASHPKLNAHVLDGILRSYSQVHLGIAVDTPRGLMVPTIRDAGSLSLREFSARSKKLAADCISGSIAPDLLSGGTFTVTNLGAFGIESFTPVLNEPQTAILGIDAIAPCPTLDSEGSIGAEMRIGFSLTVDHRVVDGADAARYLKDLADFVASIDLALLS